MATGVSKIRWNGDVLIHTIDTDYSGIGPDIHLSYEGKSPEQDILATPPANITELWRGRCATKNRLYFGDNLPIIASFLKDPSVCGKVRLIYIDPPFATSRVYQSRQQSDAYSDTLVGAPYVEYLRKRLILLRELMAEDGSIYVHLDQNMTFHIKLLMDEVFSPHNFRLCITRKKCNPKNFTRKSYGDISDYILFYTKSDTYVWNRPYEPWTEESAAREYPYVEEKTGRRFKKVPIHAPGVRKGETGKPWRGMHPPPGKHWQYLPSKLDKMDARGEIYWSSTGNPRRKVYLDKSKGIPVQNIWMDLKDAHNQMVRITGYPTEKNPDMLARIIKASSNEGDLVLDCFCGSGTTLAVASKLGRNWIGIDNSSEAIRTTLKRFVFGLERMGDFVSKRRRSSRKNPLQATLPLLESAGLSEDTDYRPREERSEVINDFLLYSVASHGEHLQDILEYWIKLQQD
jgi:adenine-specific DNA-methyltransferase